MPSRPRAETVLRQASAIRGCGEEIAGRIELISLPEILLAQLSPVSLRSSATLVDVFCKLRFLLRDRHSRRRRLLRDEMVDERSGTSESDQSHRRQQRYLSSGEPRHCGASRG
jgi:hypothetical protein